MQPSDNPMSPGEQRLDQGRNRRKHRRQKRKRTPASRVLKWIRKNPNKTLAVLLGLIIIYVTYLFIMYALDHPRKRDITTMDLRSTPTTINKVLNS